MAASFTVSAIKYRAGAKTSIASVFASIFVLLALILFAPWAAYVPLPALAGVRLASAACNVRYAGRDDVCLFELAPGTAVAGVLTQSQTASAPVLWCRRALKGGRGRAIVINSGNANAFTGSVGLASVQRPS